MSKFGKSEEFKQEFEKKCKILDIENGEKILALVDEYIKGCDLRFRHAIMNVFNEYIGWGLPSRQTCELIVEIWKKFAAKNSEVKLVDFGAGTGVFCKIFNFLGIPEENLLAIDLPPKQDESTKTRLANGYYFPDKTKNFWPISEQPEFKPKADDILFVCWGDKGSVPVIEDYVERNGKCVIILGERMGG